MKRHSQQGVALVITLIMLAVITFLAVTFLSVSRRERGSVTTATDQTVARLAADAALERVKVELLAPMLVATNGQLFDMLVSTNYFSPGGLTNGVLSPANVNFGFRSDNQPYTEDDARQNLVNLWFNPRPPVYVATNRDRTLPMDFRFYLDLNRNGRFETNGVQPVLSGNVVNPWYNTNGNPVGTFDPNNVLQTNFVGDPEWIGILERPEQPHSPSNRFVARYAFIALPAGRTLDVNYIHNLAKRPVLGLDGYPDGYIRNQGVGTWEINLAAFLADLNTEEWTQYNYTNGINFSSSGVAFDDALSILTNRYAATYTNLNRASGIFANNANGFVEDGIDEYTDGKLMFTTTNIEERLLDEPDNPAQPWPGAENPKHYFVMSELFARTNFPPVAQTPANVADRLLWAGTTNSSYGRYTYYRLLSQLGTDTGPEPEKMNVNYVNLDAQGRVVPITVTNLVRWTNALQFFTNAADRLIRGYTTNWLLENPTNYLETFNLTNVLYGGDPVKGTNLLDTTNTFCLTNIPVWINNKFVYRPSVHRLLQLAANIYDAGTNGMENGLGYPALPSVFQPLFRKELVNPPAGASYYNVYISGYTNVVNGNDVFLRPIRDLYETNDLNLLEPTDALYGVPMVIGAKKGYPNFNEYAFENSITVARRLEFRRKKWDDKPFAGSPDDPDNIVRWTNQMYSLTFSNRCAVEGWNSYLTNYPRPLRLIINNDVTFLFYTTNALGQDILKSNRISASWVTNMVPGAWTNYPGGSETTTEDLLAGTFQVPAQTNMELAITNDVYIQSDKGFNGRDKSPNIDTIPFPTIRWWVSISSRMRYILEDITVTPNNGPARPYIVDYVSLNVHPPDIDVTSNLTHRVDAFADPTHLADPWLTNRNVETGVPVGIEDQIAVAMGLKTAVGNSGAPNQNEALGFTYNLVGVPPNTDVSSVSRSNIFQAPYAAETSLYDYKSYQANDPLVHYTAEDLTDLVNIPESIVYQPKNPPLANIGVVNTRYQPWAAGTKNPYNPGFKDPLVVRSDSWDFPTNVWPNIGWLGRVHRGTPWQTVFMKSPTNEPGDWVNWTGNSNVVDALRMRPPEDWKLFEYFTTAVNENATHGQLSVNQSGLAAWSAVLSGNVVITNSVDPADYLKGSPPVTSPWIIEPAFGSPNSSVGRIVAAINMVRATNLMFRGTFQHAGDIFSVPDLTVQSPFLNYADAADQAQGGITEEMYERIPQQIMSLLRLGDARFVVYAYGQTLRPAPHSLITSGPYFGLCTNYQVTAESGTRTVMHFEATPKLGSTNPLPRIVIDSFNPLPPD